MRCSFVITAVSLAICCELLGNPLRHRVCNAAEATRRAEITGTVVDSAGKWCRGATVRIWTAGARVGVNPYCPSCYLDCGKMATSDSAGAFTIKSLDPTLVFRVLFVAKGYEPKFANVDPLKHKPMRVKLKARPSLPKNPRQIVSGQVVDSHGKPVVAALVEPHGCKDGEKQWWSEQLSGTDPLTVTDEQGDFQIVSIHTADAYDLKVTARALAPKIFPLVPTASNENHLVLTEGASVHGRFVDQQGRPLAGVKAGLVQANRSVQLFLGAEEIGTDNRGDFLFTNVAPNQSYYVYGIMKSLLERGAIQVKQIDVGADGGLLKLPDEVVEPAFQISGRIVFSDGKPIPPHTRILFSREKAWDSQVVETDSDGAFNVRGLPNGVIELNAIAKGYRLSKKNRSYAPLKGFSLKGLIEKDNNGLLVLMEPGEREIHYISRNSDYWRQAAVTEDQLTHEPLAGVVAVAGGYKMAAESTAPPTSPDDASRTIYRPKLSAKPLPTIKLLPPLPAPVAADANVSKQAIVGRVVDQVGKPVAGADVWFPVVWDKKNGRHTVHGATDSGGHFKLEFPIQWVRKETYNADIGDTVWAYAPGHSIGVTDPSQQTMREFPKPPGFKDTPLEIRLGPPTDLKFTFLSPDGVPIRGAKFGIQNYTNPETNNSDIPPPELIAKTCGTTDANGQIVLPAFEHKDIYTLTIEAPDFGTQIFHPEAEGGRPLTEFRLTRAGRIEGRVVAVQHELFNDMYLVIETGYDGWPGAMGTATPKVDADGRFVVPHIAVGPLSMYAHLADERLPVEPRLLERDQVAIAPDRTARIEIPLESTVTVHGVVRKKATKKPVARVILAIRHGSRSLNRDVTTDANGRYEARVLPGKVNMQEIYSPLEDASQSNDSRSAEYDVPDDAVNFELPPIEVVKYHELKGRALGKDGSPLANTTIVAYLDEKWYGMYETDKKGNFAWEVPEDGVRQRYELAVPASSHSPPKELSIESKNPLVLRLK